MVAYCGGGELLPGIPFSAAHGAETAELTLDLDAFRKRARIQVGDVKISTVQLVKYVANTLGGSHFDPGKSIKLNHKSRSSTCSADLRAGEIPFFISHVNGRNLLHHAASEPRLVRRQFSAQNADCCRKEVFIGASHEKGCNGCW